MKLTHEQEIAWIWYYQEKPREGSDCRKLVTLLEGGMVWVGIRAYNHATQLWESNGEPERATVLAWQHLPEPANKRWIRGELI